MLRETVEKIQKAQASADIESAECEIQVDAEQMGQACQITLPCLAEDGDVKELKLQQRQELNLALKALNVRFM